MKPLYVAVVGATGLMGRELLKLLERRQFPLTSLQLLASDRSAGKQLFFNHQEIEVKELTSASLSRLNLVFFAAGTEASRRFSSTAVKNGAVVIDQSATYRMEPWVPLVVPEVNLEDLKHHKRIIASPSAATIQMVMALAPLHRVNPIRRAVVATYQSVSGAGAAAMEELTNQAKQVLEGKGVIPHVFTHQTAFNILPEIDVFLYNGYTMEEWRIKEEAAKLMHSPDLAISASCVRVPVYIGDSQAIHVEFTNPINPEEARRLLAQAPGVKVEDDPEVSLYPQPWAVAGTDEVHVGRVRQDVALPNGLTMWVVADNLRRGAINAIQIAEALLQNGWL
ncbi:MAG: aspartate-semialdehyde dehydrogenase [Chloroflexi bacterium]|nr:aspartate-semialdehyde dehydrogenase [Chloroflexota bacterium]